ncbi:Alpha/Beta hydrolase protein, partial [Stachybotrys elegans]
AAAMRVGGLTVRDTADCDAIHLFLARGNNEPYPGRQRAMVESICDGVSNCGYEDLIYSGLYTDLYCQTAYDGVHAAYAQVSDYACQCPDAKLILLGYSQGAQIMTDFLGGGGGTLFNGCVQPPTPALDRTTSPGNRVNAVVVFGDTRHTGGQPYNQGAGSRFDGVFPRSRSQLDALEDWTSVLWAYCGDEDPICATDQPDLSFNSTEHLDYYDVRAEEAASWVKS